MSPPTSAPTWNLELLRFPKALESDPRIPALQARLRASCEKLWEQGVIQVPVLRWSEPLAAALASAQQAQHLIQGIESAERALAREARGLALADASSSTPRGSRLSRLLLTSNDGSERFYRQVEGLLRTQGTRVLALRLHVDSSRLSGVMGNPAGLARLLLVEHKNSVAHILSSLCEEGP